MLSLIYHRRNFFLQRAKTLKSLLQFMKCHNGTWEPEPGSDLHLLNKCCGVHPDLCCCWFLCMCPRICVGECASGSHRSTVCISPHCFPLQFLKQGYSMNLELTDLVISLHLPSIGDYKHTVTCSAFYISDEGWNSGSHT